MRVEDPDRCDFFRLSDDGESLDLVSTSDTSFFVAAPLPGKEGGWGIQFGTKSDGEGVRMSNILAAREDSAQTPVYAPAGETWAILKFPGMKTLEALVSLIEVLMGRYVREATDLVKDRKEGWRYFALQDDPADPAEHYL